MNPIFKRITSLTEVQRFISQEAIEHTQLLVIFDMDLTLTMPPLPALVYLSMPEYRTKLQDILSSLKDPERHQVLTLGLQVSKHQLVEKEAPIIINSIQALQIKTIVLTASLTGQLNNEVPFELQRFQKLQDLGIVLENACAQREIIFTDLPFYNVNYPVYHRGILCANGEPGTNMKGPVLVSFLQYIHFRPKQVIMVDDKKQHLAYVHHSLTALDPNIQFIGLEYLGAQQHLPKTINDEKFAAYWKTLMNQILYTPKLLASTC